MVSSIPIQESSPIANVGNGREGGDEKDMVTSVVAAVFCGWGWGRGGSVGLCLSGGEENGWEGELGAG